MYSNAHKQTQAHIQSHHTKFYIKRILLFVRVFLKERKKYKKTEYIYILDSFFVFITFAFVVAPSSRRRSNATTSSSISTTPTIQIFASLFCYVHKNFAPFFVFSLSPSPYLLIRLPLLLLVYLLLLLILCFHTLEDAWFGICAAHLATVFFSFFLIPLFLKSIRICLVFRFLGKYYEEISNNNHKARNNRTKRIFFYEFRGSERQKIKQIFDKNE